MSYFPGTFWKKFCRPDNHKPEPLHGDFWDTLYNKGEGISIEEGEVRM